MSNFKVENKGEQVIIKFTADLVASSVEDLRDVLKKLISDKINKMIMDFEGIEKIDSMGIGLLVSTHNALSEREAVLEVINLSSDLLDLFTVMRLNEHITIKGA